MCVALASGCTAGDAAVRDARESLGTVVSITAYPSEGDAETALDDAYAAMDQVSVELDVYGEGADSSAEESATAAAFNAEPYSWHVLPDDAVTIVDRAHALGLEEEYSTRLFGVQSLYEFESGGTVPKPAGLTRALEAAAAYETSETAQGTSARFAKTEGLVADELEGTMLLAEGEVPVGVDYGGGSKGLALQRAADTLRDGGVEAAVVSAGSTTVAFGAKPDGAPWRIGVEDPRDPENIIAVIESTSDIAVSTSGDYQRYFEADGVRYHHILDPATGLPARGIRSLTVIGEVDGLDSDILSTALFVMGTQAASEYAIDHDLGLYIVDDEGRTHVVPGPEGAWSVDESQ